MFSSTPKFTLIILCSILVVLGAANAVAQERTTSVVELKHKNAAQLQHLLAPHYADQAKITAEQSRLIISGSADKVDEVKDLIRKLDQPRPQFLFSLRTSKPETRRISGYSLKTNTKQIDPEQLDILIMADSRFHLFQGKRRSVLAEFQQSESGVAFSLRDQITGTRIVIQPIVSGESLRAKIHINRQQPSGSDETSLLSINRLVKFKPDQWLSLTQKSNSGTKVDQGGFKLGTSKRDTDSPDYWIKAVRLH